LPSSLQLPQLQPPLPQLQQGSWAAEPLFASFLPLQLHVPQQQQLLQVRVLLAWECCLLLMPAG
jgi:hypothetical protein